MSEPGSGPPTAHEQLLRISQQPRDGAVVVTAAGEIDVATAAEFTAALNDALHSHACRVVVDLLEVTFLGSVGLAALLQATQKQRQRGAAAPIVVATHRAVLRPVQISALDQVLDIRDSVDQALTR